MQVTAEPDGDPVRDDGTWVTRARVTVQMTGDEYLAADGLRYEVLAPDGSRLKDRVSAEPLGDPVYSDSTWTTRAIVTACILDAGYRGTGGLRYEVFPWSRFRLKIRPGSEQGTWCYEIRDLGSDSDEPVIVRRGDPSSWDQAVTSGQAGLRDVRWTVLGRRTPPAAFLKGPAAG